MLPPDPPGVPARRAALRLLDAVTRQAVPLEAALDRAASGLSPSDRGLAHAIAATVLRRAGDLDGLIDAATRQRLADDAKARAVLRIALAQALAMEVAPHAAIATALPLVAGGPRRLVHGVFSAVTRSRPILPTRAALPAVAARRWSAAWGAEAVAAAEGLWAAPPPLDLSLRDPADVAALAEATGGLSLAPGHLRLPPGTTVPALPGYEDGRWWVQDLAASLPARLAGAGDARRALDLCAAPGGKAMQLAAAGWRVTALDLSERRLERMRANLARTGLAVETIVADLMTWSPPEPVDLVLLDAPCSATGIYRRHPDVLWRVTPRAIAELAEQQTAMLARAAGWVKPGGRLVYAVCSLEREEGEAVADAFAAPGFEPDPIGATELPEGFAPDPAGRLRVPPGARAAQGGADGFFVARWRRRA